VEVLGAYFDHRRVLAVNGADATSIGFYRPPSSPAELAERRRLTAAVLGPFHGTLGRGPSFVATALAAMAEVVPSGPDLSAAVELRDRAEADDLYLAHAAIDPKAGRMASGGRLLQPLTVVRRSRHGIVVRGAKIISTGARLADELMVLPLPQSFCPVGFCIPSTTPGLTLTCRPVGDDLGGTAPYAHEVDYTAVFDDVEVPHDRVFVDADAPGAARVFERTRARALTSHHDVTRALLHAGWLVDVADGVASDLGSDTSPGVRARITGLREEVAAVERLLGDAETRGEQYGTWFAPNLAVLLEARLSLAALFPNAFAAIREIGGGSIMALGADPAAVSEGPGLSAARLVVLSPTAQRMLSFELFHAGAPDVSRADLAGLRRAAGGDAPG
jgi:4-hydroxyphenylacetate 3-monooxygenase